MRLKYESRSKSDEYVEEAQEDNRFIKNFKNYIAEEKAYNSVRAGLKYLKFQLEEKK